MTENPNAPLQRWLDDENWPELVRWHVRHDDPDTAREYALELEWDTLTQGDFSGDPEDLIPRLTLDPIALTEPVPCPLLWSSLHLRRFLARCAEPSLRVIEDNDESRSRLPRLALEALFQTDDEDAALRQAERILLGFEPASMQGTRFLHTSVRPLLTDTLPEPQGWLRALPRAPSREAQVEWFREILVGA